MLARATAATPWGIEAQPVQIEVDVHNGLPQIQIVGLPDASVRESRERVQRALKNCGFDLSPKSIVVNLAPADLRKEGNHLDLAIALALLGAYGQISEENLNGRLFCGELGLDGTVRSVRGGLAVADLAARMGLSEVILPAANGPEAAALGGIPVFGVAHLVEAIDHALGSAPLVAASPREVLFSTAAKKRPDLSDVRGQTGAKRALEIAAAGGHNLLFLGPPGSGKTMLARRLPGLLPQLALAEAIEVTKIWSLAAEEPPAGLVLERPFRSPHTGTSTVGMIGGGPSPRPGEASLAHNGVLFLDELPEFRRDTLEALRQPLEEGLVSVVRARARFTFPARFALLAAMNPCPCGHLGDPRYDCRCPPPMVERYRGRVSGPLLDRIDLHVEVPAVSLKELRGTSGETTADVAARIGRAREQQAARFGPESPSPINAAMNTQELRRFCTTTTEGRALLEAAFERLGLSARALDRVLKVSRTIADLDGGGPIQPVHLAEAIQYRSLDRRMARG
ncbi:MAG TPA: YifB family Mg chelatase-like AAA ATPase [Thermoanaerobaculia bacterium]|nr:YifB family Mg chelatase-like AAA ATPase [Thermoanaerobaculia bacterium]